MWFWFALEKASPSISLNVISTSPQFYLYKSIQDRKQRVNIEKGLGDCIRQFQEGTYNDTVKRLLPPQHKVGTIIREDYWNVFPEEKEAFFRDISTEDVQKAIQLMSEQPSYEEFSERVLQMTANDFYGA